MLTYTRKMTARATTVSLFVLGGVFLSAPSSANNDHDDDGFNGNYGDPVQVGPRPFYLVDKMSPSPLKSALQQCADDSFKQTTFSIGHRGGGTLQFPEHTKESHEAGARMGAGILECDVTFTRTASSSAATTSATCTPPRTSSSRRWPHKCSEPFTPAVFDAGGQRTHQRGVGPLLHERPDARRVQVPQGQDGCLQPRRHDARRSSRAAPRTGGPICTSTGGTLLTHKESIELIKSLGAKFTPELKAGPTAAPSSRSRPSSAARRATPRR